MPDNVSHVHFFLDGKEYAIRSWLFVPRVGDEVILGPDDNRVAYAVKRVIWGNDENNYAPVRLGHQRINIEIEKLADV